MSDFQRVKLQQTHGPDVHFEGRLVHEFSTQRKDGGKDRWTELRLWETPAGNWVAESVGMSTRGGERELREAAVIEGGAAEERVRLRAPIDHERHGRETARTQVMVAFGYTTAAKAFARKMGWDMVRQVA